MISYCILADYADYLQSSELPADMTGPTPSRPHSNEGTYLPTAHVFKGCVLSFRDDPHSDIFYLFLNYLPRAFIQIAYKGLALNGM